MTAVSPDQAIERSTAAHPLPKPGILDIHAYVPGKAGAVGVTAPIKLSANENILGCSPAARQAFADASENLAAYPGSAGMFRSSGTLLW